MTAMRYRASQPDSWVKPRPFCEATQRYRAYGLIQPMHEPTLLERLFGRR